MSRSFFDVVGVHLSADTWAWLDAERSDDLLRDPAAERVSQIGGGRTRRGWFVHAPEDMPDGLPQNLKSLLRTAREQGAEYVLFDCDAAPNVDLPVLHSDLRD